MWRPSRKCICNMYFTVKEFPVALRVNSPVGSVSTLLPVELPQHTGELALDGLIGYDLDLDGLPTIFAPFFCVMKFVSVSPLTWHLKVYLPSNPSYLVKYRL